MLFLGCAVLLTAQQPPQRSSQNPLEDGVRFVAAKSGARTCYEDPKWESLPRWEVKSTALIDHQLPDVPPRSTTLAWSLHYAPRAGYSLQWGIVTRSNLTAQGAK